MHGAREYYFNILNREEQNMYDEIDTKLVVKCSIIGVIILFVIITLFASFKSVPTGYVGVKTQFGKVQGDMLNEGINFKIPYIEKIVLMDCRTKKVEIDNGAASKDLQDVNLKVAVNYSVNKDYANRLYQTVGVDYEAVVVNPAILESIKSVTAKYTAEELITKRQEVSALMYETLTNKLQDRGFTIVDLSITDLAFSDAYNQAIEQKQVAQQNAQKAQYELEKARVENEKKVENAKAEAEVMKLQNQEITDKTLKLKELEIKEALINKWDGKYPTTMLGDKSNVLFGIGD